jgi:hypothetical protein
MLVKLNLNDDNDIKFSYKYIKVNDLIMKMGIDDKYVDKNNKQIVDIKDMNYKEKIILSMFVNKYVHVSPIVSRYNKYIHLLPKDIEPNTFDIIFRGFYVASDVLYNCKIDKSYNNILQIGVLPTFLEAYQEISNHGIKNIDFIRVNSNYSNTKLYDDLIYKLTKKIINVNILSNKNFYNVHTDVSNNIQSILSNYDLIIFDTYKNISQINMDDVPSNVNTRYLSALIHSKYIYHQIIFAFNKLKNGGDLILLLPGFDDIVYQQIITIVSHCFDDVMLCHSDLDFSYRYFLVAKNYKKNKIFLDNIMDHNIEIDKSDTLTNILSSETKLIDIHFDTLLNNKFDEINYKILNLRPFIHNEPFIKKIYYEIYHNQLTKTKELLNNLFGDDKINTNIFDIISEYQLYLFDKLTSSTKFDKKIIYEGDDKIDIIGTNISNVVFDEICPVNKYVKIYDLIGYDKANKYTYDDYVMLKYNMSEYHGLLETLIGKYSDIKYYDLSLFELLCDLKIYGDGTVDNIYVSKNDVGYIFDHFKMKDITYINWMDVKNMNIFDELNKCVILKFDIQTMNPLLISTLYILASTYKNYRVVRTNVYSSYYFICETSSTLDGKYKLLNEFISKNKITAQCQLVNISDEFLSNFNEILSKLVSKEILMIIRVKYPHTFNEYMILHGKLLRKSKKREISERKLLKKLHLF